MTERELRLLISQNALRAVHVHRTADHKSYALSVNQMSIESTRRRARTWRSLETLARYLQTMGVGEFSVRLGPDVLDDTVALPADTKSEVRKGIFDKLMERNQRGEAVG